MLARVAERIYWLSRYMERAENTARLVNVYSNLLLDLPRGSQVGWKTLISITGSNALYKELFDNDDERNVVRFLLAQRNNPSSIFNSLNQARENARTTREIIPAEAWELINDIYLFAKEQAGKAAGSRSGREAFLLRIISSSQHLTGMISGCMSHNHAYDFVVIGRNIERADMTSRIVDVGAATLMQKSKDSNDIIPYGNTLWMNVLRSLNGYQMYRQHVQDRVNGEDVVSFLLLDQDFPRTVLHCLTRLAEAAESLPNHDDCQRAVAATLRRVQQADIAQLLKDNLLYDFIDQLQLEIASVHNAVAGTWFLGVSSQTQSQTLA